MATRSDADQDQGYASAASPMVQGGQLSSEFDNAGALRPANRDTFSGSDTYVEDLAQRRDTEAASKMPRSARSWESEQQRPGSWRSGVGALNTVGYGPSQTMGQARPLFQTRGM
jgi:hypothetical protein